ncbi:hypothetical protein ACIA71_01805 [Streptomyces anulatus]
MNLPRPIADLICLTRDLVHHPRMVLLNRGHHRWVPAGVIATAGLFVATNTPGGHHLLAAALLVAGPAWALDMVGAFAHGLWQSGRIWPDLECQCCGDDPDDEDEDPDPDQPEDDGGLAADVEDWLKDITPTRNA